MKNIIIVTIIVAVMSAVSINALDRSIFAGCEVVEQRGNTLIIALDSELADGSDIGCMKAEMLIKKITDTGYDVVLYPNSNWLPKVAPVLAR